MKTRFLIHFALLTNIALSCQTATSQKSTAPNGNSAQKNENLNTTDLQQQLEQIAARANGHVGVAAVVLESGESVSLNAQDHYPMQSVYKLPIGMAVMKQVEAGKLALEQQVSVTANDFINPGQYSPIRDKNPKGVVLTVSELLRYAIAESDGTASDVLMRLTGGPQLIQSYLTGLDIDDWQILNTEKEIGRDWLTQYRNWATPYAAVKLLRALHERRGMTEPTKDLILKLMIESIPGAKRLKGLLPAGTVVAHKTGTSGARDGMAAATNDIGIITLPNGNHLAIAVLVSDSKADDATRENVIARIAQAIWKRDSVGTVLR